MGIATTTINNTNAIRKKIMNINGKTRLLGLLGDPVQHTMSPLIHNTLSDILDIDEVYVPFHTHAEGLGTAVRGAYELNILGMNATVPHKNNIMNYLVDIDEGARAIGAVNTLVRVDGGYKGYNTDMMGLSRELDTYGVDLQEKNTVILGAGGAAKAVAYMCMNKGAEKVYILNRTLAKAQAIADDMNAHFGRNAVKAMELASYGELQDREGYVVFQSTSIGLAPNVDAVVIDDPEFYSRVKVGIDLIYNPFETRFMKLCREAGASAYNGLRMLLYQGIIAYELWNDISISEDIADIVYDKLMKAVRHNIILIGFMGCGKTTVGRTLAEKLGYTLLDVDAYIEEKAGYSIKRIFADKGEEYFRQLETDTLKVLNGSLTHTVISTGGGLPMRSENVDELRKLGSIIYLDVSEEEVIRRLAGDQTRPLLQGENAAQKVHDLMSVRQPVYEAAADQIIGVTGESVEDIVDEIISVVGR